MKNKNDIKPDTLKYVESVISLGYQNFSWDKLSAQILKDEANFQHENNKFSYTDRVYEACGKALRSYYPNREKAWNEAWKVSKEQKDVEILYVINTCLYVLEFCEAFRKDEPKPKSVARDKIERWDRRRRG